MQNLATISDNGALDNKSSKIRKFWKQKSTGVLLRLLIVNLPEQKQSQFLWILTNVLAPYLGIFRYTQIIDTFPEPLKPEPPEKLVFISLFTILKVFSNWIKIN